MSPLRTLLVFPTQLIAGIAAAGVVGCLFPGPANFGTRLGGGASISQGLFIEMFLTAQLVFVIIMLAVVKHKSTFLAPVGIGLTFFVTQLVGMWASISTNQDICPVQWIANPDDEQLGDYYTGGSLNPARSLGPDVINTDFPGYHWIYWVGPLLGSLLASSFYAFLRLFQYQTVNPGQDADDVEKNGAVANGTENPTSSHSRVMSDTSTLVHPMTPVTPMTP